MLSASIYGCLMRLRSSQACYPPSDTHFRCSFHSPRNTGPLILPCLGLLIFQPFNRGGFEVGLGGVRPH